MTNIFEKSKDFKEAIGGFIIAFSEMEFGLSSLCSMTEFDLRKKDQYLVKYLGYSLDQKREVLKKFINEHIPELSSKWTEINTEIGILNKERRYMVHGIMSYHLPHESIATYIKERGKINKKALTSSEIKNLTNRLHHLNTGKNGINGEFHTEFTTKRVNQWNELLSDDNKITYSINGQIVSDWKGKG